MCNSYILWPKKILNADLDQWCMAHWLALSHQTSREQEYEIPARSQCCAGFFQVFRFPLVIQQHVIKLTDAYELPVVYDCACKCSAVDWSHTLAVPQPCLLQYQWKAPGPPVSQTRISSYKINGFKNNIKIIYLFRRTTIFVNTQPSAYSLCCHLAYLGVSLELPVHSMHTMRYFHGCLVLPIHPKNILFRWTVDGKLPFIVSHC